LEGYIIEFTTKNHQSFSWEEEIFKKDARGTVEGNSPMNQRIIDGGGDVNYSLNCDGNLKPTLGV